MLSAVHAETHDILTGITRKLVQAPFIGESPDIRQIIGDVELSGVDRAVSPLNIRTAFVRSRRL